MGKVDATEMRRLKIESLDIDTRFGSVDIKERSPEGSFSLHFKICPHLLSTT